MPNTLKDTARSAYHSQMLRHPLIVLPPNSAALYMAAITGNLLNAAFPISPTLTIAKGFGGASSINIQVTVAGTFVSTKFADFEIVGRNENWEPVTERMRLIGNGAATQNFTTKGLFSMLDTVRVLASSGDLVVGEVFTIGTSDGVNPPGTSLPTTGILRVPHPMPGAPFAAMRFAVLNASVLAATTLLVPDGMTSDGRQLIMSTNYGAAGSAPRTCHFYTTLDDRTIDRS